MANFGKDYEADSKKTNYLELSLEKGILYCIYDEIEEMDIAIAEVCVRDRLAYVGNYTYPSLFDITKVKQSTKEARDYMANEGNAGVAASAILVSSPMVKMAANFYIKVNKPKNPTRMFTDRNEAVEWLKQFKQ
ncbi:MAG: hypothetical protein LPK09_02130 [Hymenobacteraceae bacterium]|nr:hypothetical protein [Hymenobacteraceae bacterium]